MNSLLTLLKVYKNQVDFIMEKSSSLQSIHTNLWASGFRYQQVMEISSVRWLSEMVLEDPTFINQNEINIAEHFTPQQIAAAFGEHFHHSFSSSQSFKSYPSMPPKTFTTFTEDRPSKQMKTTTWSSRPTELASTPEDSSPSNILSFGMQNSPQDHQTFYGNIVKMGEEMLSPSDSNVQFEILISQGGCLNQSYVTKGGQGSSTASAVTANPPSHSQDHIIAERKRREKLSQRFIALSAIVSGLKKMDKASVLGDANKYLKQLQERVQALEEQTTKKTMESVVFVKKSLLSFDDSNSSFTDENLDGSSDEPLPEIEARVSNKDVLIRIHCEKRKGTLVKDLAEIEGLHLSIVNTSVLPFANSALDITIIAQMEEFCMTVKELVKSLHASFNKFM